MLNLVKSDCYPLLPENIGRFAVAGESALSELLFNSAQQLNVRAFTSSRAK
jgi:hypothetical protein